MECAAASAISGQAHREQGGALRLLSFWGWVRHCKNISKSKNGTLCFMEHFFYGGQQNSKYSQGQLLRFWLIYRHRDSRFLLATVQWATQLRIKLKSQQLDQTPSLQPQAPNSASYCKSLAENSPLPHTCPPALEKTERDCANIGG